MACRSEEKAKVAIEELTKETGKTALFLKLELSDLSSVERAAEAYLRSVFLSQSLQASRNEHLASRQEQRLDILFNNA
jgi:NAD(P)-dependent dehydrogenase (short-subunit alcohol dehydrogenase family)